MLIHGRTEILIFSLVQVRTKTIEGSCGHVYCTVIDAAPGRHSSCWVAGERGTERGDMLSGLSGRIPREAGR